MKGRFEVDGTAIHYEVLGEGEPVVFLNGVMMTTQSWVLQTVLFRQRYRCVMHDFRCQLLSDKPEAPFTLETHAEDLTALLDHLEIETCHVVGTSYGGKVGMIFAATRPRRVRSLTLVSAASYVGPRLRRVVENWAQTALEKPDDLFRSSVPWNYSSRFLGSDSTVLAVGEERLRNLPADFFPALARLVEAFCASDVTPLLASIECPTLVVCGEEDLIKPPKYSRLIAAEISRSELMVVPDGGHALVIERPEEVNTAILGFIEKSRIAEAG